MNPDEKKLLLLHVIESNEKELVAYAEGRVRGSQLAACGPPAASQAREIYSDLWLKVEQKTTPHNFNPEKGSPLVWLKGFIQMLVRGRIRDLNRRNKRRACPNTSVSETGAMDLVADTTMYGEDYSEDVVLSEHHIAETSPDVVSAAEFLLRLASDHLALPLRLRYLEDFSSEQVGLLLGNITANAVNQQIHRAKAKLRKSTSLDAVLNASTLVGPSLAQMDWATVRR